LICLVLLFSCDGIEPVGGAVIESEEPERFTGLDCVGSGDYLPNIENLLEGFTIPDGLPESADLSNFLPPIGNQGQQGSCVSWAVSYYMKSLQEKIQNEATTSKSTILSPAYTYNQITKGNCTGTNIEQTLDILKEKGVASLSTFPYTASDCSEQPSTSDDEEAALSKIEHYKSLSGENMVLEMKALIHDKKPIIIGAYLSTSFAIEDSFGITAYREHNVNYGTDSCHAMLVIGYSDTYNAFKVVNSWGSDWGDNGFVWIDYKAFDNVLDPSASFRVINEAIVAFDQE